jgi:hypothetical protein
MLTPTDLPLTVFPPLVQSYAGLTAFHGRFQLLSSLSGIIENAT